MTIEGFRTTFEDRGAGRTSGMCSTGNRTVREQTRSCTFPVVLLNRFANRVGSTRGLSPGQGRRRPTPCRSSGPDSRPPRAFPRSERLSRTSTAAPLGSPTRRSVHRRFHGKFGHGGLVDDPVDDATADTDAVVRRYRVQGEVICMSTLPFLWWIVTEQPRLRDRSVVRISTSCEDITAI